MLTSGESEPRVALVTGGGRGIGRAISLALAAAGADVAVNYRKDRSAAEATVAEVAALGRRAAAYQASVDSWSDDVAMVDAVIADFGHIDILVNNGGIASRGRSVGDTDREELERVVRTHALGPHHLCSLVLPHMRIRPRGDIVMVSSVATDNMSPGARPTTWARRRSRLSPAPWPRRSGPTGCT